MYRLSAMRMVRAGESPSAEAAAMSEVVLNGAGGATVRFFLSMAATCAPVAFRTCSMAACASASALKRAVACGAKNAPGPSPVVGPDAASASKAPLMTQ